jgi:hypothetical protein
MKTIVSILFLTVMSVCAHSQTGTNTPTKFICGIKISGDDFPYKNLMETYFQTASDLGMGYLKIIAGWDIIEPFDNQWRWKVDLGGGKGVDYDSIAQLSQKYGISVIPTFEAGMQPLGLQKDSARWARFVYTFINRYKNSMNIQYTEFRNEPNNNNDGSGSTSTLQGDWQGTAEELVTVDNAAYEKVKASYPDIMIGSAGFITGSRIQIQLYTQKFYERYFNAKPKFDFFALHDYPKNYSYVQGTRPGDLVSQYHIFESYRKLLDSCGYADKPILVTEGFEDKPFQDTLTSLRSWNWANTNEAAVSWMESYMQALSNSKINNVTGKIITGIRTKGSIGLINNVNNEKRNQYYLVRYLSAFLKKYPVYSGRIAGKINSEDYWIEEFRDTTGSKMWAAFNPLLYTTIDDTLMPAIISKTMKYPQQMVLNVGNANSVRISKVINNAVETDTFNITNNTLVLVLDSLPVFIESLATTSVEHESENIPKEFILYQNYPNPFNPGTTITFSIPHFAFITLKVYDILGREVVTLVNSELNPGEHSVAFDATNLSSGVYIYQLSAGGFIQTKKMLVAK